MSEIEISEGQFAVVRGYSSFTASVVRADAVTPKIIKTKRRVGTSLSHTPRDTVYAAFDSEEDARRLADAINGVKGEYQRRVTAASEAARSQIAALVAKARSEPSS